MIRIGTAGYCCKDWQGNFYPQFCPEADFLRFYATQFRIVELSQTFYQLPEKISVQRWKKETPDGFIFIPLFPRSVTTETDLKQSMAVAKRFIDIMLRLEEKLGPFLLKLPVNFSFDCLEFFDALISLLPENSRCAIEIRNPKQFTDKTCQYLSEHNLAVCMLDHPRIPCPSVQTADFTYIRLVGDQRAITEDFKWERNQRVEDLRRWAEKIRQMRLTNSEIFLFCENQFTGHAPSAVMRLKRLLGA